MQVNPETTLKILQSRSPPEGREGGLAAGAVLEPIGGIVDLLCGAERREAGGIEL